MRPKQGYWRSSAGFRMRAMIYAGLSISILLILLSTGWARLGPEGFALSTLALLAVRLWNRPSLWRRLGAPERYLRLSREIFGQVALSLVLFWLGFGLSHAFGWSPAVSLYAPALAIVFTGILRRAVWPPVTQRVVPKPPVLPTNATGLSLGLSRLPPEDALRSHIVAVLKTAQDQLTPAEFAAELFANAQLTDKPRDRLALVLGLTDPQQAKARLGLADISQVFDILAKGDDFEALLSFAVRSAALLEVCPEVVADMPRPDWLRHIALGHVPLVATPLEALALRIEHHLEKT